MQSLSSNGCTSSKLRTRCLVKARSVASVYTFSRQLVSIGFTTLLMVCDNEYTGPSQRAEIRYVDLILVEVYPLNRHTPYIYLGGLPQPSGEGVSCETTDLGNQVTSGKLTDVS